MLPVAAGQRERGPHFNAGRSPGATVRRQQARHGLSADAATLYVGTRSVALAEVTRFTASGLSTKDLSTAFATIAIFSGVSAFYVFGVLELGWRTRSLYEGLLFGLIAMCAFAELFSARRETLYTFNLSVRDDADAVFVTADHDEAKRIKAALDAVS